jgi:O-antigen ligase
MLEFIVRNKKNLLLFILWYLVGSVSVVAFIGLGAISVFLMWRRAMYFEILLGFFFILILSDNLSYTTDFAKVFKNAYIVLLALISILDRRRLSASNSLFKHFVPFLIVSLIGLFFSPYMFTGFQKTLSYALIVLTIPQFFMHAFKERGEIVVKDFIYLGILMILIGFAFRFISPGVAISHGGRFRAVFGNPNGLGIFASLLFVAATVAHDYFKSLFSKTDLRWIFITIIVAVLLSGSRSAVIGISLFFLLSRFYRLSPFVGFIGFLTAIVVAEIISANLVSIVQSLGVADFFRVETLEDGSGRFIAWNFAWESIQSHFWLGRGFAFDEWLMSKNQDYLSDLGHQGGVHNTYLIVWLNTGLIGLLMFLRAYFLLFIKGAKNTRYAFPILWMVMFSISLEPWLAASLNPYTIILLFIIVMISESAFQVASKREKVEPLNPSHEAVFSA